MVGGNLKTGSTQWKGQQSLFCLVPIFIISACAAVLSHSATSDSATPWTLARQAPLSRGFSRVGCHSLLQGIFPTQRKIPGLLHCRWTLYGLSHQGSHIYTFQRGRFHRLIEDTGSPNLIFIIYLLTKSSPTAGIFKNLTLCVEKKLPAIWGDSQRVLRVCVSFLFMPYLHWAQHKNTWDLRSRRDSGLLSNKMPHLRWENRDRHWAGAGTHWREGWVWSFPRCPQSASWSPPCPAACRQHPLHSVGSVVPVAFFCQSEERKHLLHRLIYEETCKQSDGAMGPGTQSASSESSVSLKSFPSIS